MYIKDQKLCRQLAAATVVLALGRKGGDAIHSLRIKAPIAVAMAKKTAAPKSAKPFSFLFIKGMVQGSFLFRGEKEGFQLAGDQLPVFFSHCCFVEDQVMIAMAATSQRWV